MRSIKTRDLDSKRAPYIYHFVLFGLFLWILRDRTMLLPIKYYSCLETAAFIAYISAWGIKRRAVKPKLTQKQKQRLRSIEPIIKEKNELKTRLFEYLLIIENRFAFIDINIDVIGNEPISKMRETAAKLAEILENVDGSENIENAEHAFTREKFYRLKHAAERMNNAINEYIEAGEWKGLFEEAELNPLKKTADMWHPAKDIYSDALRAARMLEEYLMLMETAIKSIEELREY